MIRWALLIAAAVCVAIDAPWWVRGAIVPPALLWVPGWGLAARLVPQETHRLQRFLDAAWLGMTLAWVGVTLCRELGLTAETFGTGLFVWATVWTGVGTWLSRGQPHQLSTPRPVQLGVAGVVAAVALTAVWRAADISRPLADHWWHTEATSLGDRDGASVDVVPERGWAEVTAAGWSDAGAWALRPGTGPHTLTSVDGAQGRVMVVAQGPIGTELRIGTDRAVVQRSPIEQPEEGPVRRYMTSGTVGLPLELALRAGDSIEVETDAARLWLLTSAESVWALHAEGGLRYVHYYQLLNQVENLDWAEEVRDSRWFTWNQPPGWSPLLAIATLLVSPDLPGCNALFVWVLGLVGLSSVRLAYILAPSAPRAAWLVPGAMTASHGLLMLEPASANFPDSLYAAAVLGVATAVLSARTRAFAAMGVWAQALRWPGTVVSLLLAVSLAVFTRARPWRGVGLLGAGIAIGAVVAGIAAVTGQADDLLFILYFETFPEHWHDDYTPTTLLSRVPAFYGTWLTYTGGGLAVAVLGALATRAEGAARLRALLAATLAYSALLATIDHHPTHYFLPLVGLTGPMVVAAAAAARRPVVRSAVPISVVAGLMIFLWKSQV